MKPSSGRLARAQHAIYRSLDPRHSSRPAEAFHLVHHVLVVVGIASVILSTVPQIAENWAAALAAVFHLALGFFVIVYALRVFAIPAAPWAHPRHPWRDRLQWARSFAGLVDLLSTWLVLVAPLLGVSPESAHLAAILWLFKFVPYSEGLALLVWWTVVTLTTTGYGDTVPITLAGRFLAGIVMISGISVFALLAGMLANGFADEVRRRDLMRTWDLVTQVPFFNGVGAEAVAEVARLLRPRDVQPGTVIMRRGEPGDCMYFVVSGEVEIRLRPTPLRFGPGAFFGEIALVTGAPRTATAVAVKFSVLLSLHLTDFRHLAARRPELTAAIQEEAARRKAQTDGSLA